jgi:mRNA interferase RelE/StbE
MKVIYLSSFRPDIKKIKDQKLSKRLKKCIDTIKKADSLSDIPSKKKLSNHQTAYRIRIGSYRLGIYCDNEVVEIARFLKREDIYKNFP